MKSIVNILDHLVMDELAELDEITYVRFASVYLSFKMWASWKACSKQITKGSKKKKDKINETE